MNPIYKYYCSICKAANKMSKENFLYSDLSNHPNDHINKIDEIPKILLEKYDFHFYLKKGGIGNVFKVSRKNDPNTFYALKIMSDEEENEIEILKTLSHPSIIKYIDSGEIGRQLFLVTELADEELGKYIKQNLSNEKIYNILLELAEGLFYLINNKEKNHISHLDLKLNNIMLKNGQVKIIDFGASLKKKIIKKSLDETTKSVVQIDPSIYSPPEWHLEQKISTKIDVWSFGAISHVVYTNEHPFDFNIENIKKNIMKIDEKILIGSPFYELIINCLKDKKDRWEMKEVLEFMKLNKNNFFDNAETMKAKKKSLFEENKPLNDCKTVFSWDPKCKGELITLSENNLVISIDESYENGEESCFRSVLSIKGFSEGIHYWEVEIDKDTKTKSKIGVFVKKNNNFDPNKCFSDFEDGYAYYGGGEIRNKNEFEGDIYGEEFISGKIGVFLNMEEGVLSFSFNDRYMDIAFESDNLKKNNKNLIFPAVSMIYSAKCKLILKDKIPEFFFNKK